MREERELTLVARGRTAEVFLWDDGQVVKLFYDWCPETWIRREADMASAVAELEIPAPRCFGTITVNNRRGIIFERVEGLSLLALMSSRPLRISHYASVMADLHLKMHRAKAPRLFPLKNMLSKSIWEAKGLDDSLKGYAADVLRGLPDGEALCHFDFHPDQILMSREGPVILDWVTAFRGDPLADVARTSILLTMSGTSHLSRLTRAVAAVARRRVQKAYLARYLAGKPSDAGFVIGKWMIPIAAARLNEQVDEEASAILEFLERSKAEQTSGQELS